MGLKDEGYAVFEPTTAGVRWALAAHRRAAHISALASVRSRNLRHGETWFVGVDVLPNAPDGSVDGVPLEGAWRAHVPALPLHAAQVSIVYPGYPGRDAQETDAAHRFRRLRHAAHVDGLLPVGPERRRFAQEFHAYILGLPLNASSEAPTMVWPGSHRIMQAALARAIGAQEAATVDVTDVYHAARKSVFDQIAPVAVSAPPGGALLLHRFCLHGTAAWDGPVGPARMIAFFRPQWETVADWLA